MTFDIEKYKNIALKILFPIKEVDNFTRAEKDFLFNAIRSNASNNLPEYFLIFFLFNDLLGFRNLGQFEKIAWSFPIDYNGKAYLIEYRKFGVGIFIHNIKEEIIAEEISKKINGAIKSIRPYFDFLAEEAVKRSEFNIVNNNKRIYNRFDYLLKLYKNEFKKYIKNKGQTRVKTKKTKFGLIKSYKDLSLNYYDKSNWLAISCIEAFFSWTEHLFIHLAVVANNFSDGELIARLIDAEWKEKFSSAIKDESKESKKFYNELLLVRQQLRNFVAHGSFGKNGNAFEFHSGTGSVPVLMEHRKQKNRFSLHGYLTFKEEDVILLIEEFIKFLRNSYLAPALYYTQDCELPTILTFAKDGTYKNAMINMKAMKVFCDYLINELNNTANMDFLNYS